MTTAGMTVLAAGLSIGDGSSAVTPDAVSGSDLVWVHAISDGLIALAYLAILAALIWFNRRYRSSFSPAWLLTLLVMFILMCGVGHALDVIAIWQPIHDLQGYEKAVTAMIALVIAIAVVPLTPKLLSMRTSAELAEAKQRLREEIAARTIAEDELRGARAESRNIAREFEQFAYVASHDLQAPLRTVSGFAQLLMQRHQTKLEGDALEFLTYIDQGSRQMQALIRDLLELSRVGRTGTGGFTHQPLAKAVGQAIRALQEPIDRSGAEIVVGALPEIQANHVLMVQLLQNLIDNAIKFQRPGQKPRVTIAIEHRGDNWDLVVADNGIGIPADQLDNVFTIFRRLQVVEDDAGTGIGLAICRKIAHVHGGEIVAKSDASGSQFRVSLPVSPPAYRSPMPVFHGEGPGPKSRSSWQPETVAISESA